MGDEPVRGLQGRPTCESCRQRKVRCNRRTPCSQCSRLQLSCVYETPRRRTALKAPSRATPRVSPRPTLATTSSDSEQRVTHAADDQPTNQDILNRLSRVEGLLADLTKSQNLAQPFETSAEQSPAAQRPVLVPPAQPCREKTTGEVMRSNYVDDSVFVGLLLDVSFMSIPSSTGIHSARAARDKYLAALSHQSSHQPNQLSPRQRSPGLLLPMPSGLNLMIFLYLFKPMRNCGHFTSKILTLS